MLQQQILQRHIHPLGRLMGRLFAGDNRFTDHMDEIYRDAAIGHGQRRFGNVHARPVANWF